MWCLVSIGQKFNLEQKMSNKFDYTGKNNFDFFIYLLGKMPSVLA